MTKIIAIANHKGGVGKTTTTAALGTLFARRGLRVLLVDLDAQANLTTSLMQQEPKRTIYDALRLREELPIFPIDERLDIVPSSLELASVEMELAAMMSREYFIKDLLEAVAPRYDYVLLDCPPSLGLLSINAFVAADELLIPLTAETLPFKGLKTITDSVKMLRRRLNPQLKIGGVLITRWNGRKLNRAIEDALRENLGELVYRTKIRENITVAEAPLQVQSITSYAPQSNGAKDYGELADEILSR
jgi:chromosome partitioning protein